MKGKPGTGKLMLLSFALANSGRPIKDKAVIFFVNLRGDNLEKSTIVMY
jgi:hypothetical protein